MIDQTLLDTLSQVRLGETAPDRLPDILDGKLRGETAAQRLESLLAQVGNPYCFRVGDTPVRLTFQPRGEPLDRKVRSYFLRLKTQ